MEHNIAMSDADRAWLAAEEVKVQAEMKAENERCKRVLEDVQAKVSAEVFADIQACLADSCSVGGFKITQKSIGTAQDDGYAFGPYFVNQTCNGGYSGDDYAGSISVPIGPGEFFEFDYAM